MPEDPRLVDELEKMEYEPLLPVEKRLIVVSLAIGVLLLAGFVIFSRLWPALHG